jgi:hypothetical protein
MANIVLQSTKIMMKTSLGKKLYNKTKNVFPLGYFVIARKNG